MKAIPIDRETIRIETENFLEHEMMEKWTGKLGDGRAELIHIAGNTWDVVKVSNSDPAPKPRGYYLPLSVLPAHCRECPAAPKCVNAKLGVTERDRPDTCTIETF